MEESLRPGPPGGRYRKFPIAARIAALPVGQLPAFPRAKVDPLRPPPGTPAPHGPPALRLRPPPHRDASSPRQGPRFLRPHHPRPPWKRRKRPRHHPPSITRARSPSGAGHRPRPVRFRPHPAPPRCSPSPRPRVQIPPRRQAVALVLGLPGRHPFHRSPLPDRPPSPPRRARHPAPHEPLRHAAGLTKPATLTPSATASPPTSSKTTTISAPSRNSSATPTSPPPRSTPTSSTNPASASAARSIPDFDCADGRRKNRLHRRAPHRAHRPRVNLQVPDRHPTAPPTPRIARHEPPAPDRPARPPPSPKTFPPGTLSRCRAHNFVHSPQKMNPLTAAITTHRLASRRVAE